MNSVRARVYDDVKTQTQFMRKQKICPLVKKLGLPKARRPTNLKFIYPVYLCVSRSFQYPSPSLWGTPSPRGRKAPTEVTRTKEYDYCLRASLKATRFFRVAMCQQATRLPSSRAARVWCTRGLTRRSRIWCSSPRASAWCPWSRW